MKIFDNKFFQYGVGALLIVVTIFFLVLINEKSQAVENERDTISVTGSAEVYAIPDVGLVDITVRTQGKDVPTATNENSSKMNAIISYLKSNMIEEKDIKTIGFNIYPVYSWDKNGVRHLDGYDISQMLEVKIRNLSKVGDVIGNATALGANDISSLSFIVDNDDQIKEQAKNLAIADAKAKANNLENALGIKLGKIVNFAEGADYPITYGYGIGGVSMKTDSEMVTPTIQTGQNKITSTVTITYSIK